MSIASVVTRGYSTGSSDGTIAFVVTRGYTLTTGGRFLKGCVSLRISLLGNASSRAALLGDATSRVSLKGTPAIQEDDCQ